MTFSLLAAHPEFAPIVAKWLFDEWGNPEKGHTLEQAIDHLLERMSLDQIPVHVIAVENDEIIGFAALKRPEMDLPGRDHWLGSVYVAPPARGRGVASALVETSSAAPASAESRYSLSKPNNSTEGSTPNWDGRPLTRSKALGSKFSSWSSPSPDQIDKRRVFPLT